MQDGWKHGRDFGSWRAPDAPGCGYGSGTPATWKQHEVTLSPAEPTTDVDFCAIAKKATDVDLVDPHSTMNYQ